MNDDDFIGELRALTPVISSMSDEEWEAHDEQTAGDLRARAIASAAADARIAARRLAEREQHLARRVCCCKPTRKGTP